MNLLLLLMIWLGSLVSDKLAHLTFLKKPRSSVSMTSAIVKQSCTSAKSTSLGVILGISYACRAALTVLGIVVMSSRDCTAAGEAPRPDPIISTQLLPLFFANSSLQTIRAEAPSENGQQS